jgi:hypothetical protein
VQRLDERQFRFADFEALRRLQQTAREHPRPAQAAMSTPMWAILIYAGIVELGSMCMFSTHTVQQIRVHEDRLALLPEVLMNLRISAESPDAPRYVGAGYTWDATRR